ncbi:hypothetical protein [Yoonia sp. BS5-3]|uniref:Ferrochelatase n=1 Tax=Yoonia phaeophyticola TaxID=3137369 RepID=A0ABZ2V7M1_9RHOB
MKINKALILAAPIVAASTFAFAGGLSDEIVEAPVEVMEVEEPSTSSISPVYIIVGVLAALLVVAALDEDEEDDDDDVS